jgi:Protein of unknown function (DUF1329)
MRATPRLGVAVLLSLVAAHPLVAGGAPELTSETAEQARGLLPPEILDFYKKGEWRNAVAEWPNGKIRHGKEFDEATRWNAERLALDANNGIVDKATGKKPATIVGFPFPKIDSADPQAGAKIIWNYFYAAYDAGSVRATVDLAWVSRRGLDRAAGLESQILYYDGQPARYRPKTNPQNVLAQTLASVLYPQDLYSTTVLAWRFRESDKRDLDWTYVPAQRRVREVSPANRSDGFLGSDLTQDDGAFFDGKPEDFTWKLAGETEMYRLADPFSLHGDVERKPSAAGGWQTRYKPGPFVGFEDAAWKGAPWAPVAAVLAKRKLWIVEAVPKDRYYLYGKIELYVDQEGFLGAWNRKFSWKGELLSAFIPIAGASVESTAADGSKEWLPALGTAYFSGLNLKMDRATVTGFPLKQRDQALNETRVVLDPATFDYQSLQRLGK